MLYQIQFEQACVRQTPIVILLKLMHNLRLKKFFRQILDRACFFFLILLRDYLGVGEVLAGNFSFHASTTFFAFVFK